MSFVRRAAMRVTDYTVGLCIVLLHAALAARLSARVASRRRQS